MLRRSDSSHSVLSRVLTPGSAALLPNAVERVTSVGTTNVFDAAMASTRPGIGGVEEQVGQAVDAAVDGLPRPAGRGHVGDCQLAVRVRGVDGRAQRRFVEDGKAGAADVRPVLDEDLDVVGAA